MYDRQVPFYEFEQRIKPTKSQLKAATQLWNSLAKLAGYKRKNYDDIAPELSLQHLLSFTTEQLRTTPGIGLAQLRIFEILQKSLRADASPLRDEWRRLTREGLGKFAVANGWTRSAAGQAWGFFRRGSDATPDKSGEVALVYLEEFCASMSDRKNWPQGYGKTHNGLLQAWLKNLK